MTAIGRIEPARVPARRGLFYGWVVVWAAFTVLFMSFGAAYSFTAFFNSFQQEFGLARGSTAVIFSIAVALNFFAGAWSGKAGDRIGPKPVVLFGTLLATLGLVFAGLAERVEQVYWGYGLGVGIGVGCMYVPAIGAVQRWFVRRRATTSGLAIMGIGFGTLLGPLTAAELIDMFGWRQAYFGLAIIVFVFGGLAALLLENNPATRGLHPDGGDRAPTGAGTGESMTLPEARRTAPLWLIYVSAMLVSVGLFVPFAHLVKFAQDLGLPEQQGLLSFTMIGVGSIVGRMALGPVAQRFGVRPVVTALYFGIAGMFGWWLVSDSFWMLLVFGFVFGSLYGGFVALAPTLVTSYYGVGHAGTLLGFVYSSVGFGCLFGPPLAGYLFDIQRSYELPIMSAVGLCVVAAVLLMAMSSPRGFRNRHFGETH
ncbi:MAG: MFS transporter [Pseudomonadota bacterium]|nr:MFS transporter [Pseudomonadota bacterium]